MIPRGQKAVSPVWLLAGPLAAAASVGVDLAFGHRGAAPLAAVSLSVFGLGLAAGLLVGGLVQVFVLSLSGKTLFSGERIRLSTILVWWQLLSLPWLPLSWILAEGTLSGHSMRTMADPVWSVPLAALVGAWTTGLAILVSVWMLDRRQSQKASVPWRWVGILALLGLAGSLSGLNALLYVRLYPEIHAAMTLVAFFAFFLAFGFALPPLRTRRAVAVWLTLAAFLVGAILGRPALGPLRRSQTVRRLVFALPTTGLILSLVARHGPKATGSGSLGGTLRGSEPVDSGIPGSGPIHLAGASVLLVTVDALRADRVGCFGLRHGPSLTPHLDRLCRDAVRFERTYCHAPHSSYSLSSIQTGMPMRSLVALGEPLPRTLAEILSSRGYRTEAFCTNGIFFTEGEKLTDYRRRGFGFHRFDPNGYDGKVLTDKAIDALHHLARGSKPFYLWVHYFDVHEPYRFHPGVTQGKSARARYDGEVRYVDPLVARLIGQARHLGRPVLVVLTADHGEEFGEHGGSYHGSSLYEEQVRVPLLWWLPGIAPRTLDAAVSLIDVMPTILDVLGIRYQGALEGRSLADLAVGGTAGHGPVFSEVSTKKMVVDGRFKLIYDSWRTIFELYDLVADPGEKQNLADSKPSRLARLRELLAAHAAHLSHRLAGLPRALALARLGDARAKEGLCRLLLDPKAEPVHRIEAARRLAKMPGGCSAKALCEMLLLPGRRLRQEAAVALGELESDCGRAELLALLSEAVPARLRHRAAVAAGRLGLREAQPYLVEALGDPDATIRYRAGHYLGRIGDRRAVRALMAATADRPAAHLVAFALGRIGARGGGQVSADVGRFLLDWLPRAHSLLVKRYILKAMGLLGRPDLAGAAVSYLGRKSVREAEETLVRCQGIGRFVFGVDFSSALMQSGKAAPRMHLGTDRAAPVPWAEGLEGCRARKALDFKYLHATSCRSRGPVLLGFMGPEAFGSGWKMSLRVRPLGVSPGAVGIRLWLDGRDMGLQKLTAGWQDVTWRLPDRNTGRPSRAGNVTRQGADRSSGGTRAAGAHLPSSHSGAMDGDQGAAASMPKRLWKVRIQAEPAGLGLELDHLLVVPPRPKAAAGSGPASQGRQGRTKDGRMH